MLPEWRVRVGAVWWVLEQKRWADGVCAAHMYVWPRLTHSKFKDLDEGKRKVVTCCDHAMRRRRRERILFA